MRYFFGFIIFLLLVVVGLIFIFSGHKSTPKKAKTPVVMTLPDYAQTNAQVSMTIDGPVNGEDAHRAIRVSVGRDTRTLDIIQGYSGRVIDTHTFMNTSDAYDVFLRAINTGGFSLPLKKPTGPNDSRGQCPEGTRDTFKLTQGDHILKNLWTSNCGRGNFGGNPDLVQSLFQRQITDYDTLTSGVQL